MVSSFFSNSTKRRRAGFRPPLCLQPEQVCDMYKGQVSLSLCIFSAINSPRLARFRTATAGVFFMPYASGRVSPDDKTDLNPDYNPPRT